jgi:two-component system nitrate/nitrite response regulator NarL
MPIGIRPPESALYGLRQQNNEKTRICIYRKKLCANLSTDGRRTKKNPADYCKKYEKSNRRNGKLHHMARVLLCTDEPILAEGLTKILAGCDGLDLCSWCAGVEGLAGQMAEHEPDLLLVDMTNEVTFSVLNSLHGISYQAKIVLWVHTISTELALQAMSLGIRGILRKTLPVATLLRCLDRVREGELWFDKALTDSIMGARRYSLTRREGQLVTLLSQGLKNKEIASALTISEGTVKVYLSRLFQKLGVKDRFELALYGLKNLAPGAGSMEPAPGGAGKQTYPGVWQPPRSFFVERVPPKSQPSERLPLSQFKY